MNNKTFFKILASLPIILIALYFIPFLGVCLILLRYFMFENKKRISTPMYIIGVGFLVLIPSALKLIFNIAGLEFHIIPFFNEIVNAKLYNVDFINYSKRLICIGVLFLIISFVFKSIFDKLSRKLNNGIINFINDAQRRDAEISKQNDMEIKIKQEKAKNTCYVKCSNCGSDNLLAGKFGICKYCRRTLENKSFK